MMHLDELRQEILSYLLTKAEHLQKDFYFKSKNLFLDGLSPNTISYGLTDLYRDGIVDRRNRNHTPSTWKTKFFDLEGEINHEIID